ncbi:sugar porter family MFS transporter [Flavobacterium macrobrachii]|uniref:Sugar porter family MFS transporter n=1 Tax=Flavobacterium macrobrachii TaxID=591204 RepID=A0ABS2CW40_9FLAO|nr:sugar porter family MFS transporter [Flavobacterium macrobrachii]MBM6498462.1 sugar porter family MFS transporter [Flavobacterium macrobrachii]
MDKNNKNYILFIALSAALGGLLFGYDTAVISGAIGNLTEYFHLTPVETGWAISSALVGCLIGAFFSDYLSNRFGRKATMIITAILFILNSIGTVLPTSFTMFVIFRIVGGIGVGIASMVVPMYIAEIAPPKRRGALVGNYQLAIVIGIVVVYFVNYLIALQGDANWNLNIGWRWMFGSEIIPSILFLIFIFLIPESPRWLFQKEKHEHAILVLEKLNEPENVAQVKNEIQNSLQQEDKGQWKNLVNPIFKKALFVGIGLSILQQLTGINAILYYAPEIFKSLGSSADTSLLETSILGVVNLIFTLLAIKWVDKMGRKPLLYIGSIGMTISLAAVGFFIYYDAVGNWVLPFLLLFMASFSISWGPIVWVLLSEIFPNKIRSLALAISVFIQWVANFVVTQFFPSLVENQWLKDNFNGAFPFYLFSIICLLSFLFVWKKVPETKNKSLEEMDTLWK